MLTILFTFLLCVNADVSFQSDIAISGDPSMPGGLVRGHLNYFYNTSLGGTNHLMSLTYQQPVSMTEIWVFQRGLHYRYCQRCSAETYRLMSPQYFKLPTDQKGPSVVGGCQEYTRVGQDITQIWVDETDPVYPDRVCQVVINGVSGQRTIVFNATSYTTPASRSQLTAYQTWSCPAPTCHRVMDVMLIIDESTSINETEWTSTIEFATALVNKFRISTESVVMGVVFFSTHARVVSYFSNDAQSIINALTTKKNGGYTCIGCGLSLGMSLWNFPVSGRTQLHPAKIMITLTDGANNEPGSDSKAFTNLTRSANNVHNAGIVSFAIGVGSDVEQTELELIASTLPTGKLVIRVNDFASLERIIDQLVTETCQDLPSQPCGSSCYGFCGCEQTCVCPPCEDLGSCWHHNCTLLDGKTLGCLRTPVDCDDHNACTEDTCNSVSGCQHTMIDWDDGNPCTDNLCAPGSGPYLEAHLCDDQNACTEDTCDPTVVGGCVFRDLCDDHNVCTEDLCNPLIGCYTRPTVCDDHDACTIDTCDPLTGCHQTNLTCVPPNRCLVVDSCSPLVGCRYTSVNCEDGNICTANPCDPNTGCLNYTIPCEGCLAHPLNCTDKINHRCQDGQCAEAPGGTSMCEYTDWIDTKCNSHNPCIVDSCSIINETCFSRPVVCQHINCTDVKCNPESGFCDRTPRDCSTDDPCVTSVCDVKTDRCLRQPFCPTRKCQVVSCSVIVGVASCAYTDLSCASGSYCLIDGCDNQTGQCVHLERQCQDDLVCTDDRCDPTFPGGCVFPPRECDDNNPCTDDWCNETVGCYHTPKCDDGLFCTDDVCLPDGTCLYTAIQCPIDLTPEESSCFVVSCNEKSHCYRRPSVTAVLDMCGNCLKTYGTNISSWNTTQAKTQCIGSLTWPRFATTLTASAIAGIIIAGIIGAIIVAVSGFFGTRELIKRARAAQDQAVVNNPFYQDGGKELQNPTYMGQIA